MIGGGCTTGWVEVENGVGLTVGDADGPCQRVLFPKIAGAGEINFLRELVEDADGYGLEEVMVGPFVVVVFDKAAGVGAGDKKVVGTGAVDYPGENFVYESLRGR